MTLYTRRQILVLLLLLAVAGLGLAIGQWRRAKPELVESLEQLDRVRAPSAGSAVPGSGPAPQSDASVTAESVSSEHEPRRSRPSKVPCDSADPRTSPNNAAPAAIDLNRATAIELTRLPGIGPAIARRIVAARDTDGRFGRIDELGRIRGMSPRKIEQLRAFATVE